MTTNYESKENYKKIYNLTLLATDLPCGYECTYPDCDDECTENGKSCMERILGEIQEICQKEITEK